MNRRSRMVRSRSGKRIELTRRDVKVFRALARYRYLSSSYLHAFAGGTSEKRFVERLGDLFHEGFVGRPKAQWEEPDCRYRPTVYETEGKVHQALEGAAGDPGRCTYLASGAHRQFQHALMICEALASMELAARVTDGLRFIPWSELLSRAPETTRLSPTPFRLPNPAGGYLVPDGVFGLEYEAEGERSYRFFALEVDRGTMPIARTAAHQTSYLGKLAAYRAIVAERVYKSHLGVPNWFVLTLTVSEDRCRRIASRLNASDALFLFKAVDRSALRFPIRSLLDDPWERANLPPLSISR